MGVIFTEEKALQALRISNNVAWNALTFHFEEIDESIHCASDTLVNQRIRLGQLGAALTPIIKPAIDAPAPLSVLDAPQAGTGKSLLCDVIAIVATGRAGEMFSAPKDEDEWRKVITTALMSGTSVVIFDNVTRPLESGDLCSVLTASTWADRAMRTHSKIALPVKASFMASGNNVRLAGDMPRRCYRVRLDAKCSTPFWRTGPEPGRTFTIDDLKSWTQEHRGELLAGLLRPVRAWYVAGKPKPKIKPLESFGEMDDNRRRHFGERQN